MESYIIGGLGGVISIMLGAIWHRIGRLDDKFGKFDEDCRIRHENILTSDEWVREHTTVVNKVDSLHSRVDKLEVIMDKRGL